MKEPLDEKNLIGRTIYHTGKALGKVASKGASAAVQKYKDSDGARAKLGVKLVKQWVKKIRKDWITYQHHQDMHEPTEADVISFAHSRYGVVISAMPTASAPAATAPAAPAAPAPAAPAAPNAPQPQASASAQAQAPQPKPAKEDRKMATAGGATLRENALSTLAKDFQTKTFKQISESFILMEDGLSKEDLTQKFVQIARTLLKNPEIAHASEKYDPNTPEFATYLGLLRKNREREDFTSTRRGTTMGSPRQAAAATAQSGSTPASTGASSPSTAPASQPVSQPTTPAAAAGSNAPASASNATTASAAPAPPAPAPAASSGSTPSSSTTQANASSGTPVANPTASLSMGRINRLLTSLGVTKNMLEPFLEDAQKRLGDIKSLHQDFDNLSSEDIGKKVMAALLYAFAESKAQKPQ